MQHGIRGMATVGLISMAAILTGCAPKPPYLRGYRYAPEPALVDVMKKGGESQRPPITVMVSVIGIRRGGRDESAPPAVEIRMRFENNGSVPMTFDPATLTLVTGTLQIFEPPEVHGPRPLQLRPADTATIGAFFPFPPGARPRDFGTDSLRLNWQIQLEGQVIPQTAYFERTSTLYYGPD